jgi:hypothetical protein
MGSHKLFAGAGLKPQSSQFQPPKLARITGVSHQAQLNFTYFMHTQYGHLHCAQAAAHHTQSFPLLFFFFVVLSWNHFKPIQREASSLFIAAYYLNVLF